LTARIANKPGRPNDRPRNDPQKARTESAQRDAAFFRAREEERRQGEEKSARLRALRLAKAAADRSQAERDALLIPPKRTRGQPKPPVA
jgi:hypothetical protein